MVNPYQVLGVKTGADLAEVKKAYRSLARRFHPDVGGDEEKFKEINEAYKAIEDGKWVVQMPRHDFLRHETLFTFSRI